MSERNRLSNGRFLHDLDNWTASDAAYSAGDGDEHYGVAVLEVGGGYVEQDFTVPNVRRYTLHLSVKAVGAVLSGSQATARIVDGDGNTVTTKDLVGTADLWTENVFTLGLAPGTTYTLWVTNASASDDVKVDDVWLWWVPMTRAQMAQRVHTKLGRLATERSLSTAVDYDYAIEAGLRQVGAINPETDLPDVRYLGAGLVDTVLDMIEREMLERLRRDYAVEVDIQAGPHRESLSQISRALGEMTGEGKGGQGAGANRVVMRKLGHEAADYEFR
jgi:hypothetical protein